MMRATTVTIDEDRTRAYVLAIARACRALREAGLDCEADALRSYAANRVVAARAAVATYAAQIDR